MTADPRNPRRQHEALGLDRRRNAVWRDRIDPVFVLLIMLTTLGLGAGLLFLIELSQSRLQRGDTPVSRVTDARLLENAYRPGPGDRFQSAAYHAESEQILVADGEGGVSAYHRGTELWRNVPPPRPNHAAGPPILRADQSSGPNAPKPAVWAYYRDGYLTRFQKDEWRALAKASRFLDSNQKPVAQENLTAAAIDANGTWLALAAKNGALGLYNQQTREWWTVPIDIQTQLSWSPIETMVWWRDFLWIGTRQGLFCLRFPGGLDATLVEVDPLSGDIKTLFADEADRLLVLSHGACAEEGNQCVRIHRFDHPDEPPSVLLDTYDQPTGFGLNQLRAAHQSGDDLFLAGESGLLRYNLTRHSREVLEKSRINDSLLHHDGQTVYYAGNAVLGRADGLGAERWAMPGELFYELSQRPNGDVYAVSDKGTVFQIFDDRPPVAVFRGAGSQLNPNRFFTAVAIEDYVLLVGPDGALLHHLRERSYRDLPKNTRISWLLDPTTRLHSSSGHLYALSTTGGEVFPRTIQLQMVVDGNLRLPQTLPSVPAPVRRVRDWPGQGLGLIGGDGAAYLLTPNQTFAMSGTTPAPAALSGKNGRVYDVLSSNQSLLVATDTGFHEYLYDRRVWRDLGATSTRTPAVELARFNEQILFRTNTNRLARINRFRPYLIGSPRLIDMEDNQLRDVLLDEQVLYLAGNERVVAYDLQQRQVKAVWRQAGAVDPRIQALVGGEPLVQSSGKAFLGERPLFAEAGLSVRRLSFDGNLIWAVLERGGNRTLQGVHPNLGTKRCMYRTPYPHDGAQRFDDAVDLPNGHLAVLTERGLQFYNPFAQSWFRAKEPIMRKGGRMFHVGDHLLLVEQQNGRGTLWHVPIRSIRAADPCSDEPYHFQAFRHDGRAFTVDPKGEQAAWIDAAGTIQRWQRGALTAESIEKNTTPTVRGPERDALRSVFVGPRREHLIFATDDQLYRYDLPQRLMHAPELIFAETAEPPYRINMQYADLAEVWHVSLKDRAGRLFQAEWDGEGDAVSFEPLTAGATRRSWSARPPTQLTAAQGDDQSMWFFFDPTHLYRFDPEGGRQLAPIRHTVKKPRVVRWGNRWAIQDEADQRWYLLYRDQREGEVLLPLPAGENGLPVLDALDRVWQINERGHVVRLEAAGRRFTEKEQLGGDAPILDPDRVQSAWEWNELTLVVAGGESQVIDQVTRKTFRINDGPRLDNLRWIQSERARLWAGTDRGILELNFGNVESGLQQRWLAGEALHRDQNGRLWRHQQGSWRQENSEGRPDSRLIFPYHRGGVFSWSRNGFIQTFDGGTGDRLPFDEEPMGLIGDDRGTWWFLGVRDARLLRRERDSNGDTVLREQQRIPFPENLRLRTAYDLRSYQDFSGDRIALRLRDGREVQLQAFAQESRRIQVRATAETGPGYDGLADSWPEMKKYLKTAPNGKTLFDPYTGFEKDRDGYLYAVRASGERLSLGEQGTLRGAPLPSLDVGWLRYQQDADAFIVQTSRGERAYPAGRFLDPRRGLLTHPSAVLKGSDNALVAAFPLGILRFPGDRAAFGQAEVTFEPVSFRGPVHAYHHTFVDDTQAHPSSGSANPPPLPLTYQFGPVSLVDDWRKRDIHFQADDLAEGDALYRNGTFLWDRTPDRLTFDGDGKLLGISRLGLLEIDQLARFLPLPPDADPARLTVPLASSGSLHLRMGPRWFIYTQGAWQASRAPQAPPAHRAWTRWLRRHEVAEQQTPTGARQWRLKAGQTATPPLRNAVATRNSLFVLTNKQLTHFRFLPNSPPPVQHDLPFTPGDDLDTAKNDTVIISDGSTRYRWDPVANQLHQTGRVEPENPPLVDWKRLRFRRSGNRIIKELQSADEQGLQQWRPFQFVQRRFPFDVITGLAVQGDQILVGSAAGLQHYRGTPDFAWDALERIWSPKAATTQAGQRVTRLGVPVAGTGDGVRVRFGSQAFLLDGAERPRPITAEAYTALRADHPFWRWTRTAGGRLQARYRAADSWSAPISFAGRQAPHDQLKDLAFFNNRVFVLWRNGWVSQHLNQLAIDQATVSTDLAGFKGERFIVVVETRRFGGVNLKAGVYLTNPSGNLLRFNQGIWQSVNVPALKTAMQQRESDRALVHHHNLRLVRNATGRRLQFEIRDQTGQWQVVPWQGDGRLAIDRFRHIFFEGEHPVALTDAGLISVTIAADGNLQLDPAAFEIVAQAADGADLTQISEGGYHDGRLTVRLNERSDALYRMEPPIEDRRFGTFRPIEGADPFANPVMVRGEAPPWTWYVRNRQEGAPGEWHIELATFEVVLGSRGFQFDELTQLAPAPNGGLYVVSRGAGWFHITGDNLHLKHWRRPTVKAFDPAQTSGLVTTWQGGQSTLAVTQNDGRHLFRDEQGQWQEVAALNQLQAVSDRRIFERSQDGDLRIRSRAFRGNDGPAMVKGRFSEDVALGFPLIADNGYVVPTAAGLLESDTHLNLGMVNGGPFPSLENPKVPRVLLRRQEKTLYLGKDGFYDIQTHERVIALNPERLTAQNLVAVGRHGDHLLEFQRDTGETVSRLWVHLDTGTMLPEGATPVLVEQIPWFQERPQWLQQAGEPPTILFQGRRLVWQNDQGGQVLQELGDETERAVFRVGNAMYVVTNRQMLKLDLPDLWRQYQRREP